MVNPLESGLKKIVSDSKYGSQRAFSVPIFSGDLPGDIPSGMMYANKTDNKVFLKVDETTTVDLTAAPPLPEEGTDFVLHGSWILTRTLPGDRLLLDTVTAAELAPGAVTGSEWAPHIDAISEVRISSPTADVTPLTLDVPFFSEDTDVFVAKLDGVQKFRVGPSSVAIGPDLDDSVFSIASIVDSKTLLRGRGRGDFIYFEHDITELPIFTVDEGGDTFVGGNFASGGTITSQGGMSVDGPLTVNSQADITGGVQIGEDLFVGGGASFGGAVTFTASVLLPSGYGARLGNTAWLRSPGPANRMAVEGVANTALGEIQLGSGGPVLRNAVGDLTSLYVGSNKVLTAPVGGLQSSQIAFDTITGGASVGIGNIAGQTIQAYNIKDGSVIRQKLAANAVGSLELDPDIEITDDKILTLAASKLISGILDANEIFMGPNGTIYMGPVSHAQITQQRVQLDAVGLRSYNSNNDSVAEVRPGFFMLRSALTGSRLNLASDSGLTLYDQDGSITAQLATTGVFSLSSKYSGSRTILDSQDGLRFIASPTRNMAYNPGFNNGSQAEAGFNAEGVDDQRHIFAGEYAIRLKATVTNSVTQSYVDVPYKNTVGTGTTVNRTRTNYCPNPSLATVITGWSSVLGAATGARAAALGFARDNVLKLTAVSSGSAVVLAPVVTGLTQGQQWTLSCYARCTFQVACTPIIQWINSSDVVISEQQDLPVTFRAGIVEPIYLTGIAPANTAKIRLKLVVPLSSSYILEVSNALYERVSGPDEYVDGDTLGFTWSGLAGNSVSNLTPVPIADSATNLASIFVWSDVPCWTQVEGRDSTAGVSRGMSVATQITPNQWTRVFVPCTGVMDKLRLHAPTSDQARQIRVTSYLWYSGLQVERDVTKPTPFCAGSEPGSYWEAAPYASASLRDVDVVTAQLSPSLGVTVSGAIVGGSITASSFFAGLVAASEIRGGLIKGSILQGNYITGDQIVANTLTGDKFLANTLISNVSVQTGVTGRRILISGPNNEIRFMPQADETRYARLYSYVPAGLPDDISVELSSIRSNDVTMISRVRIQPNEAFIGLTSSSDSSTVAGGLAYCNQDYAFLGTKAGSISQLGTGTGAGIKVMSTGELRFSGWFANGPFGPETALMVFSGAIPNGTNQINVAFGGYTMASDIAPIATGVNKVAASTSTRYAYVRSVTRTGFSVLLSGNTTEAKDFVSWIYRKLP